MPEALHLASVPLVAVLGAALGSFLNVVAHRIPRGESLLTPGSRCPSCITPIKPLDNLPVVGWLRLRGRCRSCGAHISPRYPIVEALSATLAAAVVIGKDSLPEQALGLLLVAALVPIALIDLDHRLIPNQLTLFAAIAAIGVGAALRPAGLPEQLIAGGAAGGFLLGFVLAHPQGMGMGDVKLAAVLGLLLGRSVAVAGLVALLSATVLGGLIMAKVGFEPGRRIAIPFGPFLVFGGLVGLFAGPAVVHWYLHAVG